MMKTLFALIALCSAAQLANGAAPVITTSFGRIYGTSMRSQRGATIFAYQGIPYAKPPLDELRFAAPIPYDWQGENVISATENGPICPQVAASNDVEMSENCLSLNVFSKATTISQPVIVYIHGGANERGSGHSAYEAGPQYLLDQNIVLVTFNYRLGALGFLSMRNNEASGNFAYLDQVLVLNWVRMHIAQFGGDPNLVTLFGTDTGAISATLHMVSPLSRGLFARVIAMSGSATSHLEIDNVQASRQLAHQLNCPMYESESVLNCLRQVSWQQLINASATWHNYGFPQLKWSYEIDNHFLTQTPNEAFQHGHFHSVPIMTGWTRDELDFTVFKHENNSDLLRDISRNFQYYAPQFFHYKDDNNMQIGDSLVPLCMPRSGKLWNFYIRNETISDEESLIWFGRMFSDSLVGHSVNRLVRLAEQYTSVYYYRLEYIGQHSLYLNHESKPRGFGHADELHYIMPGSWYGQQLQLDDVDMFMVDRFTKWFASFARNGFPILDEDTSTVWWPTSISNGTALRVDKYLAMNANPYQQRYQLWDELFFMRSAAVKMNATHYWQLTVLICFLIVYFKWN